MKTVTFSIRTLTMWPTISLRPLKRSEGVAKFQNDRGVKSVSPASRPCETS